MSNHGNVGLLAIIILCAIAVRGEFKKTIIYDDLNCTTPEELYVTVSNDEKYSVKWYGEENPGCKLTFAAKSTNRYVCIVTEYFDINDCSVNVEYYSTIDGSSSKQVYGCLDESPGRFCSSQHENKSIRIQYRGEIINKHPGMFDLRVTSLPVTNNKIIIAVIVGSVVLPFLIFKVIICCCLCHRAHERKRQRNLLQKQDYSQSNYPRNATLYNYQSMGVGQFHPGNTCPNCNNQPPPYESHSLPTNER